MLQSVPDPFDSYGQHHSEDQIFSILPPLSILAPSSSPSSLAVTPPTTATHVFATGTTAGWAHGNGALYSDVVASSEWADAVPSSSASGSLRTPSPSTPTKFPRSLSSPPRLPNRPSSPPGGSGGSARRAESKLRSVLSIIDEAHSRQVNDAVTVAASDGSGVTAETTVVAAATAVTRNGPVEVRDTGTSWLSFPFGDYPGSGSQDTTPRNSRPASPTLDTGASPEARGRQTPESDRTTLPITS
jgi:hypothetical protein